MHNRSHVKSRKAISPILATLLLIVIAVAAIVVTYAWIMTYMGNVGQQATVMPFKSNVRFYVDSVDGSTKKIDITMGNSGTGSQGTITAIYIGDSSSSQQLQATIPTLPVGLPPNGIATTITITYNWTAGNIYYFKVQCNTGTQVGPWPEQAPT
jgi:flagellin-like protein